MSFYYILSLEAWYFTYFKDVLSQLVFEKVEIIENSKIDTNTNKKKKEAWNSVHTLFNSSGQTERSLEQIQSQWRKIKSVAKTKNSSFLRQQRQTGGGPPPEPLSDFEEQLISRIPKQFEHDSNVFDSNAISQELSDKEEVNKDKNEEIDSSLIQEMFSEDEPEVSFVEEKKSSPKGKMKVKDNEGKKRMKLLDLSIQQKEDEMKLRKIESEAQISVSDLKKKILELQQKQMIEEHEIKMEKLKLELNSFKKNRFFE